MGKKPLSFSFGFWLACFGFGVSLGANVAFADNTDLIVQADSSAITVTQARMSPVHLVSVAERVSYRDINFNSATADAQLQKRIRDAAVDVCQKLDARFPESKPSGRACVALAVKDALRKVHADEMAAQRKASN
jgi:UrcA family protein